MALYKEIKQSDGVTTKYHRILFVQTVTNHHNSIAVLSYVDEESRDCEKTAVMSQPYVKSITYETAYTPDMNVESAYKYLKTLPEFDGAVDI
jgi:hypothetical protein